MSIISSIIPWTNLSTFAGDLVQDPDPGFLNPDTAMYILYTQLLYSVCYVRQVAAPFSAEVCAVPAVIFRRNRSSPSDYVHSYTFRVVRLSFCRLSHSRTLLKPFDGFRCHLAGTLAGSNGTFC